MTLLRNNWTDGEAFAHTDQNDVANEVNSKVDLATLSAKGDIYAASGPGVVTGLAVGSNNQVLMADSSQSTGLRWGTVSNGTFADTSFVLQDNTDATKQVRFEVSQVTTGTTRVYTMPNADTALVGADLTQTLTNKTISGASNTLTNVGLGSLAVTGTPGATTYLRGDGTWTVVNVVDDVAVVGDAFQFLSDGQPVGDPVSLLIAELDGGSPSSTSLQSIDGGTL